jgi:potassium efflux system protein
MKLSVFKRSVMGKRMTLYLSGIILLLLSAALPSVAPAQKSLNSAADAVDISKSNLERLRKEVESDDSLDAEIREKTLGLYDEALKALSAGISFSSQAEQYRRDQAGIPRLIESLEAQLLGEPPFKGISVSGSTTASDVEQLLQQVGAELAARREAVQSIQQSTSRRNTRRTEINRRIAALDQQIYEFDSSIESTRETMGEPLLKQATLANLASKRFAAQQEIKALNEELTNLNLRRPLRILREQRADRRVAEAIQRMTQLEKILKSKVDAEISENLSRIRRETAEALERYPNLKPLTDEIQKLAEQLFGPGGVEKRAEPLTATLNSLREDHKKAARIMEVAKSKYLALGNQAELQRWAPVFPPDMPQRRALQEEIAEQALRIADAKATLVGLNDRRASQTDMDTELATLLASLKPAENEIEAAERQSLCRRLLLTRTELLDRMISKYADYYAKLIELDQVSKELLSELEGGYQFILERIFWRRSIAGPLIPAAGEVVNAGRWLFLNPEWPGSILRSLKGVFRKPFLYMGGLVLVIFLLRGRKYFKQRLPKVGKLANECNKPLRPLLASALYSFLLAAPVPLAMAVLGLFLISSQPALIAEKVGAALLRSAFLTLGLELIVQIFRTGGFAQIQFGLSSDRCREVRREIRLMMLVLVPASLVFLSFGNKVADHVGDPVRIAHLESLGRIAFVVGIIVFGITSLRFSRWLTRQGKAGLIRFTSVFLALLGLICIFAALLSIFGWHLSAFVLALLILRSSFLMLDIALITIFIERLRQIREKLLRENEIRRLSEHASESEEEAEVAIIADKAIDVETVNRQVGESIRLGAIVVLVLGLYFIWSAQIPSLRFLERVQLLPSIEFLAAGPAGETKPPIEAATSPKVDSIEAALKPDSSMQSKVEQAMPGYSLTLAGLLGAIGILLFLIVLAKYLPSLLDFAILSRFKIAGGDRKAITTVVSYIFVIIGLSAAASKMGLRWSQVQWLAAAFSFGLGFGLQDIFANFFSGLVLLFERPMRVGDFCRFGDQLGTVESIGLRSTKVRGLDRTIINVPNADFSKKELINYAKRDRFLLRTTIGLRYETTDEQLRYVLAKLRELLLSHPKMLEEQARVRFVGYGEYSLDIEIFAYALARDWAEFLGIREDVFLRIKLIVEESGSGFAFPSQTHYLSRDQGLDAERTAAAEAQVQTWRSENRLPFPDFSEKQRRLFRDSLDYPPAGSPYAGLHAGPTGNKKARDDRK